jgi:hypothetical protein
VLIELVQGQEKTAAHGLRTEPWRDPVFLEPDVASPEVVANPTTNCGQPKQTRNPKPQMMETCKLL